MATWLVHLRVADLLLDEFSLPRDFLVGNIAPDCGFPDGNGGFDPPSAVTHWTKTGRKRDCGYNEFAAKMFPLAKSESERALMLGYYTHLVTDVLWVKDINEAAKRRDPELYRKDREEFFRRVKADWYDNDAAFLRDNSCAALTELSEIRGYDCSVFPYYGRDNIQKQIENIAAFYRARKYDGREFVYITSAQIDEFVVNAAKESAELLREFV
ncbi:MAG: zinc dependent phospholipase C family protein [Ruminococcaceae bacterium]|nr:zinc dependent phospholipase C family protein [Oscillospiraceae bacterium]